MGKNRFPRGGPRGGMGGGANMNQLMKQAQKMQRDLEEAQEEAATMTGEAVAGGGVVKVTVNNEHQITELVVQEAVVDTEDVEMLQDLITAAVNEAMRDLDKKVEERMSRVTGGGLGFPGF